MTKPLLNPDILFPADPGTRKIARELYQQIKGLPLISPHGHTDPAWFAKNEPFPDPAQLLVVPDHYIFRMLYSQGVALEDLGVPSIDGSAVETDSEKIWQIFADHYYLFYGTPTRLWLDHSFSNLFGIDEPLNSDTAASYYQHISQCLARDDFLPRALYERFNLEVLATTQTPLDDLADHKTIAQSDWKGRVISAYRPDCVVDPDYEGFGENIEKLAAISGCDTSSWQGYLEAHRNRRAYFIALGATSTDHGHPSARTANLGASEATALFDMVLSKKASAEQRDLFRGQMLTEMAKMSIEDGLVMQLHPGSRRNHNNHIFERFGRDKGFDIPTRTDYAGALKPLLDALGNSRQLTLILFTLDETAYSRELAPLAGAYPALKLGPAWWFFDSAAGMKRYREQTTETAGFYNSVGFNDDTRAFPSIPARHDVARRVDCSFLAELVATHQLRLEEAQKLAVELTYSLAKKTYKL
ncbi:Uronate isomerase [hydrothermal vent metagenome]|uniref:Uronate isomerase n=1 Tax=hydrothermal vent metagenome TaxID=652676 RepID=A0A3B0UUM1_9ZZZZ